MQKTDDVHLQFANFFSDQSIRPWAYLLSHRLSEGHICIDANEKFESFELPDEIAENKKVTIHELAENSLVGRIDGIKRPFVLHNKRLYLQRYFAYETAILTRIKSLILLDEDEQKTRFQQLQQNRGFIKRLFKPETESAPLSPVEIVDWQLIATIMGVLNNFTIVTGGPGTGKTTTVAKILAILYTLNPELKVALAAPTGKAAFRMAESLKNTAIDIDDSIKEKLNSLTPSTLHRLLKPIFNTPHFRHNADNPIKADVVIVDEASMVDVTLFAKLLNAIGPSTRLILLGDKDQLASVEAGSVLGDLCQTQTHLNVVANDKARLINSFIDEVARQIPCSFMVDSCPHPLNEHIIELKRSRRFSSQKGIGKLSKAFILNDKESLAAFMSHPVGDDVTIDPDYSIGLFNEFALGYGSYVEEQDIQQSLKKLNQQRVLCAVREGLQGMYETNRRIEEVLRINGFIKGRQEFYENRPVMVTQNNPTLGLFNGDVGIVRKDSEGHLKVWFEDAKGALKAFNPGYLGHVETVFAMTIHKSQGSEFERVMVILPNQPNLPILTRELVYTAITRAKSKVVIQSGEEVIWAAAERQVERASGLMCRFDEKN